MIQFLIAATLLFELIMYVPLFWSGRLFFITVLTTVLPGISAQLIFATPSLAYGVIAIISVFRVFNYLRIAKERMHPKHLLLATKRTSYWLVGAQAAILAVTAAHPHILDPNNQLFLIAIAVFQFGVAIILFFSVTRHLRKSRYTHDSTYLADRELPTVTVAIPARNETDDLAACLRSVLASNYPKLEVIVLDDCSQLKTSEVIKSFAHDGVRFIKGSEPDDHWLAKNKAYDRLAEESSGQLLLFCGVDVRFGENAIRALVTTLTLRKKKMISVMPRRLDGTLATAFIQPLRYWWEVGPPRRLFKRPPVLSTLWLIDRKAFDKLGGMAAVSRQIIPEAFFARELARKDDSYSFMRASNDLDVETEKQADEQLATALRVRYPQIHRRPEMALLLIIFDIVAFLGPVPVIVWAVLANFPAAAALGLASTLLLVITHVTLVQVTSPATTWMAFFNFPFGVAVEIIVGTTSMIRYEFGTIEWKERNICIPVMHTVPRLPKIN